MPSSLINRIFHKFSKDTGCDDNLTSNTSERSSITLVEPEHMSNSPLSLHGRVTNEDEAALETSKPWKGCIQLCPHETLPFERIERILELPQFKTGMRGIDALGGTVIKEHSRLNELALRDCKPQGYDGVMGTYELIYLTSYSPTEPPPRYPELQLIVNWTLKTEYQARNTGKLHRESWCQNKDSITRYLDHLNISMCPHNMISDPWIVHRIYVATHPEEAVEDPIDEWIAREAAKANKNMSMKSCEKCKTTIEVVGKKRVEIEVRRRLGRGNTSFDKAWIAQCIS